MCTRLPRPLRPRHITGTTRRMNGMHAPGLGLNRDVVAEPVTAESFAGHTCAEPERRAHKDPVECRGRGWEVLNDERRPGADLVVEPCGDVAEVGDETIRPGGQGAQSSGHFRVVPLFTRAVPEDAASAAGSVNSQSRTSRPRSAGMCVVLGSGPAGYGRRMLRREIGTARWSRPASRRVRPVVLVDAARAVGQDLLMARGTPARADCRVAHKHGGLAIVQC